MSVLLSRTKPHSFQVYLQGEATEGDISLLAVLLSGFDLRRFRASDNIDE